MGCDPANTLWWQYEDEQEKQMQINNNHEEVLQGLEAIAKLDDSEGNDSKKRAAAIEALVGKGKDDDGKSQTDRLVRMAIGIIMLRQIGVKSKKELGV